MLRKIASILLCAMALSVSFATSEAKTPKESAVKVFTVNPRMSCQNCENKIKSNLRFEKGVSKIETSLKKQTVTITFDPSKTNKENIVKAFKKIGYTATEDSLTTSAPCVSCDGCQKK